MAATPNRIELIVGALKDQISDLSLQNAILRADIHALTVEKQTKERESEEFAASLAGSELEDKK